MKMGRVVRSVAAAAIAFGISLCDAAPRVDIRIISRPRPEPETPFLGPFPYREPADPTGPFASYVSSVGCITKFSAEIEGKSVLIDLCHLKNVTFIEVPPVVRDATETLQEESDLVLSENSPVPVETSAPPLLRRQIMGIFRGWKLDPIYKKFKYAVFDDGDLCGEHGTERLSVAVELVRASDYGATPRLYDLRKLSSCSYVIRVEAYVGEYELDASSGIQTPGVVGISDAEEMLPQICGEMKCQYSHVAGRVDVVKQEIESLKKSLEEMVSAESSLVATLSISAAASIIKSSTDVMEKALEMLQSIENLEQAAHDARAAAVAATKTETTEVTATS